MMKTMTKGKLERKGFIWLTPPHRSLSLKEVRAGTQTGQEPRDRNWCSRPWRGAAYWLAHRGLFNLLSYRIQPQWPKDGTTQSWLDIPHQSLLKKMPYRRMFVNGSIFSTGAPSFSMTLVCVSSRETSQHSLFHWVKAKLPTSSASLPEHL